MAMHSLIAMLGGTFCALLGGALLALLLMVTGMGSLLSRLHLGDWYGPFVWWPGLLWGIFLNRRNRDLAACFTWIPGLLWLAIGILGLSSLHHDWAQIRVALFPLKQAENGMTEGLYEVFHTWPAVNSVAYSIGAVIALFFKPEQPAVQSPPDTPPLN
jgi:predicted membrane channel-forming protein YqfA (hemolysin III family)